jgi:hypothetical protein
MVGCSFLKYAAPSELSIIYGIISHSLIFRRFG